MAVKKTFVDNALADLQTVTADSRTRTTNLKAKSERVVPIPVIAVFTELPFAPVGTIGGEAGSVVPSETHEDVPAAKRVSARRPTTKRTKKSSAVKRIAKRDKKAK